MKQPIVSQCNCDSLEVNQNLLSVEQARELALELAKPVMGSAPVSITNALGRVSAKPHYAPSAMPFFDNSAMDGYAVSTVAMNGEGPWKLPVGSTVAAGSTLHEVGTKDATNQALRIFTGAPVPQNFDAVVPQENCIRQGDFVQFDVKPKSGSNIRYAGSDINRGSVLLNAGAKIAAHHIGLLAVNGYGSINVRNLPKVAVFSTGDELIKPGEKIIPGQIYDCNKPMLTALLAQEGIEVEDLGVLPDNQTATRKLIENCRDKYDLILSTGSVSVGERDHLKAAFVEAGGHVSNWKVAVKPGKPIMFGKLGNTVFTGLPGNPFAVFVGFNLFVKPQLLRLCGVAEPAQNQLTAVADFNWERKPGRAEVFPVTALGETSAGLVKLQRLGNSVSATLFPLSSASGLAQVPADCAEIKTGDQLLWQPFCA